VAEVVEHPEFNSPVTPTKNTEQTNKTMYLKLKLIISKKQWPAQRREGVLWDEAHQKFNSSVELGR
jgi:hypothetical protein